MTTSTRPAPAPESGATYALRGRRQNVAVLAVATLVGLWLGTSAPSISPVATPPAPTQNAVVPAPVDLGPARPGRPR
jgi:hypothetical protein